MLRWFLKWVISPILASFFAGGAAYWYLIHGEPVKRAMLELSYIHTGFLHWLLVLLVAALAGMAVVIWNFRENNHANRN